jgi:hypothetical protein
MVLVVLAIVILALALTPRKRKMVDLYRDNDTEVEPATAGDGYHFKSKPNVSFEQIKQEDRAFGDGKPPTRQFGKRIAPPVKLPTIALTPRQIERVNIQRKLRGKPPLNRAGIKNAVAHAWDQPRKQPDNSGDWLVYLILYECLLSDHQGHTCAGAGGFTIDPNLPYNGAGGEFAGAGASGDWTSPDALRATAAPPDTYSAPSAPDPSPSYSSSSDSSSSSSSSSDSSSSSSDSGGGGGGE